MSNHEYTINDFYYIAAGAAILASGGGGSYRDAISVLDELAHRGWDGVVPSQPYDGVTNCCVLAFMGSPDAAESLTLADIEYAVTNTIKNFELATGVSLGCVIPVEIGPINSLVPLIAAALTNNTIGWVVDGDGAGRAVPELPQTTYSGNAKLPVSPGVLGNSANETALEQSAILATQTAAQMETLAGGIVAAYGQYSGIALWPSNQKDDYALTGSYIVGTLSQAWALGQYLLTATSNPTTDDVAAQITSLTGRKATATVTNFYVTAITQSTTSASLDTGIIRLDNTPNLGDSTETHYIYNLNENLIMYSSQRNAPDIIAPDSICYYSESTGRGFSNATDDLALYFDSTTGKSTGETVSIIKIEAAPELYKAAGVVASFAELLRNIGYAGALPYPD